MVRQCCHRGLDPGCVQQTRRCLRLTSPTPIPLALPCVQGLAAARVVHYDLKADNVLLEPLGAGPGGAAVLWAPPAEAPAFRVVLADFGESRMFEPAEAPLTLRCAAGPTPALPRRPDRVVLGGRAPATPRASRRGPAREPRCGLSCSGWPAKGPPW